MSTTQTGLPTCYRHPDRETGLSCSECGRAIGTECMSPAPVDRSAPGDVVEQHGLADPGVAADHERAALTLADVAEQLVQRGAFLAPAQ